MRRRRKNESLGSLDSLLDTMTSVVGILIIMLIVLQLDVKDTVKRIVRDRDANMREVTEKELDAATKKLEDIKAATAALRKDVDGARAKQLDARAETAKLQSQVAAVRGQLSAGSTPVGDVPALKKLIADRQKQVAALENSIEKQAKDYRQLRAMLEKTPVQKAAAPVVISVPAPRPAPEGSKPSIFVVRAGQLFPVDLDELRKIADQAIAKAGVKKNADGEIDGNKVIAYFKRVDVGNKYFRLRPRIWSNRLTFDFENRPRSGETRAMLANFNSKYQTMLRNVDRRKVYLTFHVWDDGFKTYSLARELASRRGFAAGWRPEARKEGWHNSLGHRPIIGFKEAQRKAAEAAKNNPKPPPKKPDPRKKPTDVVD
jgi:hypothetical protein